MVRIATSGMYFPGTMERAVLVAGDTSAIKVRYLLGAVQFTREGFALRILLGHVYSSSCESLRLYWSFGEANRPISYLVSFLCIGKCLARTSER